MSHSRFKIGPGWWRVSLVRRFLGFTCCLRAGYDGDPALCVTLLNSRSSGRRHPMTGRIPASTGSETDAAAFYRIFRLKVRNWEWEYVEPQPKSLPRPVRVLTSLGALPAIRSAYGR